MSTDAGEHQLASIPLQYIPLSLKTLGIYQLLEKRSARSRPFDMRNDKSKRRHNRLLQCTIKTGDETGASRVSNHDEDEQHQDDFSLLFWQPPDVKDGRNFRYTFFVKSQYS